MAKDVPRVPEEGQVRPAAGVVLAGLFLALLYLPAALQPLFEIGGRFGDRRVQALDLFRAPRGTLLEHVRGFEKALEKRSVLSDAAQPWVQRAQLAALRQGNGKAMVGPDGWLFYRPDVEFVAGPAFSGAPRARRPNEEAPRNADPFPAIVSFHEELRARGVDLVLAPVPVKPTIRPEKLLGRYDASQGPPQNASLEAFWRRLEAKGVAVVDLTRVLWEARDQEEIFLPLDSHWSPRGMAVFADALAAELRRRFPALAAPAAVYETRPARASNFGDILEMLRLPPGARPFPRTSVELEQVIDPATGAPVESDPASPVVLLGDSATNIFSAAAMNWGAHAGLAERLCLRLGRPLHWIAVNGGAATEVRRRLAAEGLAGKSLVVWQFILRDLGHADPDTGWEEVPLPAEAAPPLPLPPRLVVRARVAALSGPPLAGAAEIYPDTLTRTLYAIEERLEGDYPLGELVAAEWAQLRKRPTRTAEYRVGDVHHLVLEPLREARRRDQAIGLAGTVDDVRRPELPAFWVLEQK